YRAAALLRQGLGVLVDALIQARRKHKRPRRPPGWSTRASKSCRGPAPGACLPPLKGRTVTRSSSAETYLALSFLSRASPGGHPKAGARKDLSFSAVRLRSDPCWTGQYSRIRRAEVTRWWLQRDTPSRTTIFWLAVRAGRPIVRTAGS